MSVKPAVLALLLTAGLVCLTLAAAAVQGLLIRRGFDLASGSPRQLALERRTYLVSTALSLVMAFEIMSLFLLVYVADDLHELFVGAMCAAGTFNVNSYGYTALTLKTLGALGCGVWLAVNHADTLGYDYPLLKSKYLWLSPLSLLVILADYVETRFLLGLAPDQITSCCGAIFSEAAAGVAGTLSHVPPRLAQALFVAGLLAVARSAAHVLATGRGARIFAAASAALFAASLIAVVSFISVFWYELPTHHCPFCLIQAEYGFVGYPLYAGLILGTACGLAVGALAGAGRHASLAEVLPRLKRRLTVAALAGFGLTAAIAAWPMIFSDFRLG